MPSQAATLCFMTIPHLLSELSVGGAAQRLVPSGGAQTILATGLLGMCIVQWKHLGHEHVECCPPELVSTLVIGMAGRQVCPLELQANPVCPHSERENLNPSFCFANMPLETGSMRKTHHRNPFAADFHLTKLKCECLLQKMAGNLFVVISWRGSRKPKPSFRWLAASSIFCGSSSCQLPGTNC